MSVLKLKEAVVPSRSLMEHIHTRESHQRFYRRGSPGRKFVALDETIVLKELAKSVMFREIVDFMHKESNALYLCCVSAQLLHSNSTRPQTPHRDHQHGYKKYFSVVFTIDGSNVDTMISNASGEYECADCSVLVYDTFHDHFGPSGKNYSKVFVGFADPFIPEYGSISHSHVHSCKNSYPMVHRDGTISCLSLKPPSIRLNGSESK